MARYPCTVGNALLPSVLIWIHTDTATNSTYPPISSTAATANVRNGNDIMHKVKHYDKGNQQERRA